MWTLKCVCLTMFTFALFMMTEHAASEVCVSHDLQTGH